MIRMENISLRSVVRVIQAFAARETVLVVAVAAALASCVLVPPDAGYAAYVDWHTLALLFCLMAVVAGFRSLGVLDAAGAWLVARARTQRAVVGVLVGLAFFASMAVTNDVALITFVPLALVVLRRAGMEGRMCLVATLMTIAANLGSMFTPVGNPQNLYLFTASGMGVGEFSPAHGAVYRCVRSDADARVRAVLSRRRSARRGWCWPICIIGWFCVRWRRR